jgi:hypothetical protein
MFTAGGYISSAGNAAMLQEGHVTTNPVRPPKRQYLDSKIAQKVDIFKHLAVQRACVGLEVSEEIGKHDVRLHFLAYHILIRPTLVDRFDGNILYPYGVWGTKLETKFVWIM